MNDHVARSLSPECKDPRQELENASRHVVRLQLDCLKSLAIAYREKIERLRKDLRFVDLTKVNDGIFYPRYRSRFRAGMKREREAKVIEHKGQTEKALNSYEKAYNSFAKCSDDLQSLDARLLKMRFWKNPLVVRFLTWLFGLIVGAALGVFFSRLFDK